MGKHARMRVCIDALNLEANDEPPLVWLLLLCRGLSAPDPQQRGQRQLEEPTLGEKFPSWASGCEAERRLEFRTGSVPSPMFSFLPLLSIGQPLY